MLDSYFSSYQLTLIGLSLFFLLSSIFIFEFKQNIKLSIFLLILSALLLKLFIIILDPFVHMWDEQVHALVAKNLANNMLKPTLYPEVVLPYDYVAWWNNYIWVHKQPFFLWQMALCIKLFGATVYAIRLPGALWLTFATFCVYRIGTNFATQRIGFYSAIFFSLNNYINELASGLYATDHNDTIAIACITASLWAFSEYLISPKDKKWILIIGVIAGFAVLTKWTIGLFVYSGWFFYVILEDPKKFYNIKNYFDLIKSFLVTLIVALPWQIFILKAYPREAEYEFTFNAKHFNEALEGHGGNNWYYFEKLSLNYGYLSPLFCLLGIVLLYQYAKTKRIYSLILFYLFFIYAFFTLAATKMPSFAMMACAFMFISLGAISENLFQFISSRKTITIKIVFVLIVCVFAYLNLGLEDIQEKHSSWKRNLYHYYERKQQIEWKSVCESIDSLLPDEKFVIFNCPVDHSVKLMFYTNYIAYYSLPSKEMIDIVKSKGYKIAVLDNGNLAEEVYKNPDFTVIQPKSFKPKSIDTVFIRTKSQFFLSCEPDGKLICNNPSQKQVFIVKTFEDGCSQIKLLNGPIAKIYFESGGVVVANRNEYTFTEKFQFKKFDAIFSEILSEDGVSIKIGKFGEKVYASNNLEAKGLFELVKVRN